MKGRRNRCLFVTNRALLDRFAEFRVKLVFYIQAENIISSISTKYPLLRDDQKSSWKWVSCIQFSVLYTSGNHYFIHFWWLWIVSQQWGFFKVHENSPKLRKKCNSWDFPSKQYCLEPHLFCKILEENEKIWKMWKYHRESPNKNMKFVVF